LCQPSLEETLWRIPKRSYSARDLRDVSDSPELTKEDFAKARAMKKPISTFKTDKEAEDIVARVDLTNYDLSGGEIVRFELKRKDKSVNLRLPAQLLEAVQNRAKRVGMPYQRFIRMALERALHDPK
jgi:predicted DNA binding CopG/RHH family protein